MIYRYFAVTQRAMWAERAFFRFRQPMATVHAKEWGETLTACGLQCFTWEKLWHERFPIPGVTNCPACAEIAGAELVGPRSQLAPRL